MFYYEQAQANMAHWLQWSRLCYIFTWYKVTFLLLIDMFGLKKSNLWCVTPPQTFQNGKSTVKEYNKVSIDLLQGIKWIEKQ